MPYSAASLYAPPAAAVVPPCAVGSWGGAPCRVGAGSCTGAGTDADVRRKRQRHDHTSTAKAPIEYTDLYLTLGEHITTKEGQEPPSSS